MSVIDLAAAAAAGDSDKRARTAAMVARALASNGGGRAWREWKRNAVTELMDLIVASPRMNLFELSLEGDLEVVYEVRCPVPRWPQDDRLVIGDRALCHLVYQDQWRFDSPPGWGPIGIIYPPDPFHSNMKPSLRGALCLGELPPNTKPKQLVLMAYDALTLQAINIDETDPAGVLNPLACEFFRHHPETLPLTRASVLDPLECDPQHPYQVS